MSDAGIARYYYINEESKKIMYHAQALSKVPEGYIFCGLSELPIKGAAGYYAKNQPGYSLINGDENHEKETQQDGRADVPTS